MCKYMKDNEMAMSTDSRVEQFEKEFRENVTTNLNYLRTKIDEFPVLFANRAEMKSLSEKVEKLEESKNRLIGGILLFNFIVVIVGYMIKSHF